MRPRSKGGRIWLAIAAAAAAAVVFFAVLPEYFVVRQGGAWVLWNANRTYVMVESGIHGYRESRLDTYFWEFFAGHVFAAPTPDREAYVNEIYVFGPGPMKRARVWQLLLGVPQGGPGDAFNYTCPVPNPPPRGATGQTCVWTGHGFRPVHGALAQRLRAAQGPRPLCDDCQVGNWSRRELSDDATSPKYLSATFPVTINGQRHLYTAKVVRKGDEWHIVLRRPGRPPLDLGCYGTVFGRRVSGAEYRRIFAHALPTPWLP